MTPIEKMARAISLEMGGSHPGEAAAVDYAAARAALEAIRMPSFEMTAAGERRIFTMSPDRLGRAEAAWTAMVDKMLEGG